VGQVIKVYERFIGLYPELEIFIHAKPDDTNDILKSLGLIWRIYAMINALHTLYDKYGEIPSDPKLLMEVPGIGSYIANATMCFSMNMPVSLVDTNTLRVIGRVFGLDLQRGARRKKDVINFIGDVCSPYNPRDYYYSMIDLAHMVCLVKKPLCEKCPVRKTPCTFHTDR